MTVLFPVLLAAGEATFGDVFLATATNGSRPLDELRMRALAAVMGRLCGNYHLSGTG